MRNVQKVVGGVALLAVLTACGGGDGTGATESTDDFADGSAEEITKAAGEAMQGVDSLRMAGEITTDGEQISLDMQVSTVGDCQGSLSLGGGSAELISVGSETWFKPDEAFWRATAGPQADQIISVVGDKWVVVPPEEAGIASLCDLDELTDELASDDGDQPATKGETEEVDGQDAIVIESETSDGDPLKGWVAVDGEHYILKMEVDQGAEPGTITFSDFDEEVDIQAPPEDDVIDFSEMG